MDRRKTRVFKPGAKDWFLAASFALIVLGALLYFLFYLVPYQVIFIAVNFFFLYVGVVFILEYWEKKKPIKTSHYPSVTVLVPAYNSERTIEDCLRAVKAMEYPRPFETIVLIDGSKDRTYEIAGKFRGIRIWNREENIGKAAAMNKGIRLAKGEIIVTIDSDTYPEKNALMNMMGHFSDAKVGAVISIIRPSKPKTLIQRVQEVEYMLFMGFSHTVFGSLDSIFVTPGPMSAYRKKALMETDGFDENNVTEDTEIALHLRELGYRIVLSPDSEALTEVPDKFRGLVRQRLRWFRGAIYNGRKYFHMLFNPKYGDFGKFVYPINFIMQGMAIVTIARMLQLYVETFIGMAAVLLQVIPISIGAAGNIILVKLFTMQSTAIFMVATTLLWAYTIFSAFEITKVKIRKRHLLPILVYMTIYPIFMTAIYFISFIYEIANKEVTW